MRIVRRVMVAMLGICVCASIISAAEMRRGTSLRATSASAQEMDGAFVGLEFGYGNGINMKDDLTPETVDPYGDLSASGYEIKGIPIIGVNVGYKHFITSWFGLRYYANFNYMQTSSIRTVRTVNAAGDTSSSASIDFHGKASIMSYAANIDALFNFYNGSVGNIGAFLGFGVGYQNWDVRLTQIRAHLLNDLTNSSLYAVGKLPTSALYADAKVGLRAAYGHHSVDLTFKMPFIGTSKDIAAGWYTPSTGTNAAGSAFTLTFKQSWAITLGYAFTF